MKSEFARDDDRHLEALSALGDGQADRDELDASCEAWHSSAELRRRWHAYALIGDVLRSRELAQPPARDADFLCALRVRLAQEPSASGQPERAGPSLAGWADWIRGGLTNATSGRHGFGIAAIAAGGFAVLALAVVLRAPEPEAVAPIVALAVPAAESASAGSAQMLRSPDLDRYLSAHRQFAQGPALAAPGGMRQVAVTPDAR